MSRAMVGIRHTSSHLASKIMLAHVQKTRKTAGFNPLQKRYA